MWEEPVKNERGRKSGKWVEIAKMLSERPGEWALVAENDWAQGARAGLLSRGCEVSCRGVNKPQAGKAEKIYARYIGQEA